jgi:hypothetical protein
MGKKQRNEKGYGVETFGGRKSGNGRFRKD